MNILQKTKNLAKNTAVYLRDQLIHRPLQTRFYRNALSKLGYHGAKKDRLTYDWDPYGASADEDIIPDLPTLRARSRDLAKDDPHTSGLADNIVSNVIGRGIRPQSRINADLVGVPAEEIAGYQKAFENVFAQWAGTCDASRKHHFDTRCQRLFWSIVVNGEAIDLPVIIRGRNTALSLFLMDIEADRLDTPPDKISDKSIRGGVKVGEYGDPQTYFIRQSHPGGITQGEYEKSQKFSEIPAFDSRGFPSIFHLFIQKRAGQHRGVPWIAPVMRMLAGKNDFMNAEVVKQKIAACIALVISSTMSRRDGNSVTNLVDPKTGKTIERMFPGMVARLIGGDEVKGFSPGVNAENFEKFIETVLRAQAAAVNTTYEETARDFSKVNYSSARAALLLARRQYNILRDWFAQHYCHKLWQMALFEAYLLGIINPPKFITRFQYWTAAQWIGDGWQYIDPAKEANANKTMLETRTTTLAQVYADKGQDWEQQIEQIAREEQKLKELGITRITAQPKSTKKTNPEDTEETINNEDD